MAEILSPGTVARIRLKMEQARMTEADLTEQFTLGSGAGGQKVNKTASTVLLKHLPSGVIVRCGKTRSRETNRWIARRLLADKLLEAIEGVRSERQQQVEKIRRQKRTKSRRQKAKMVEDKRHRSGTKRDRNFSGAE